MKETIRFLHTADLHLDSPFKGMRDVPGVILQGIQSATLKAFDRIIETAIHEQVDFVLMVGDVFDVQSASLKSLVTLKRGLSRLDESGIHVYISFGNHDYDMLKKVDLTLPDNTYIFPSEEVTVTTFVKGDTTVYIYGFSYEHRAVTEPKVVSYEPVQADGYHIATLHGSLQTNADHDVYAPFQLEELKAKPFDYWALGHIHKRELLAQRPYIVYPGNIQGRHMKETGEKGCYVVDMSGGQTHLQFHPVHEIVFLDESYTASAQQVDELVHELKEYKQRLRQQHGKVWLRLRLMVHDALMSFSHELSQWLNDHEKEEDDWVWVTELNVTPIVQYDRNQLKQSSQFVGEVLTLLDEKETITPYLSDLLQHRQFKQIIGTFSDDDLNDIRHQAEEVVINQLLSDGRD
ncbi:DNA repair exonuclease SbcCD nuclease subunit [Alkalibacillus flavidus]|uniref:DNA repair exonuclease SbcCD nuclease subunit n=1 Tax=Alkalibacillus flavidus TaxID=546021 RepID=A0ABV2KVB0_9BACI